MTTANAWKGCSQCGSTSDMLAMFTRHGVCGKCARANHRQALGITKPKRKGAKA